MTKERRRINELKQELADAREELRKMTNDRTIWRNEFMKHFKWFIKLLGEKGSPSLPWLIEDMSKTINKVETFYW